VADLKSNLDSITIEEYPTMGLRGALQNRRSDIGIGRASGPKIWIEAKTVVIPPTVLRDQLVHEETALRALTSSHPTKVIALVPANQADPDWPSIHWRDVVQSLELCARSLRSGAMPADLVRGYLLVVDELRERISSHPSGLACLD